MNITKKLIITLAITSSIKLAFASSLIEIYKDAQLKDPTLLGAKAERDQNQALTGASFGTLLPQVGLTADALAKSKTGTPHTDTLSATIGVTQSVYDPVNWRTWKQSEFTANASNAAYESAKQQLIVDLITKYTQVLLNEDILKFSKAQEEASAQALKVAQQKFNVGLSPITDVYEAKATNSQDKANVVSAQNDVSNSLADLGTLTGKEYFAINKLNNKTFNAKPLTLNKSHYLNSAKKYNLNLLTQKYTLDASKKGISIAWANFLPTLSVNGSYEPAKNYPSGSDSGTTRTSQYGAEINMNLFSGGSDISNVHASKFSAEKTRQDYILQYRTLMSDTSTSYTNILADIETIKAQTAAVVSAQSAYEASLAEYKVGTGTITDVLDNVQTLADSQKELSKAKYDYINDNTALKQNAGTLSDNDVNRLNNLFNIR
ncbi:hypothetical protein CF386_04425 [Paraphotobacterium marinum]|uniref:Outer membrane channel protein TolC n=1 Tax=Paraphotobacterium marinum TaxID=1755811 RepID=A0A220VEF6_9GAMM|nr:TolC family outer membrane protein [Paraphotobacterium marinum]ASK78313.1 hypothetical protein CF386_04425 [Paraphotobacterium marinum]